MSTRIWARWCLTFAGFLLLVESPQAFSQAISAKWSNVGPLILGRRVALVLPNGVRIEGKPIAVHPDSLELDIAKTSDARAEPKGKTSIPRSSVSALELKKRRIIGRIVGTAAGTGLGILGFVGVSLYRNEHTSRGATGTEALLIPAGAAGGYLLGWLLDRDYEKKIITISGP